MRSLKLTTPIGELPDWHFATGGLPGVSDEDMRHFEAGALPDVCIDAIVEIACEEIRKLATVDVPGVQEWMSPQRRSN
jgi:hypothetical protein